MNKKEKKILITIIIIMLIAILIFCFANIKNKNSNENNYEKNNFENNLNLSNEANNNQEQVEYQENTNVENLKQYFGKTGNSNIYEVETEYDGRKTLQVKPNLQYKVAFAGIIKKSKPTFDEVDTIYQQNNPTGNGIFIEKNSREKIIQNLNNKNIFKSDYKINEKGYIEIVNKNSQNENDKKLEKAINSNKNYIVDISNIYYIIDDTSGEILDYNFANMDEYQTYEYVENENNIIIFINENNNNQLNNLEIIQDVLDLMN